MEDDETGGSKGRATPSRREAEAARKKAMKTPMTRKQQLKRDREARRQFREKQQSAMRSGDENYLPVRDRGPLRRFSRDYIDRRLVVGEFLLPVLVIAFVLTTLPPPLAGIGLIFWLGTTLLFVIDELILVRKLKAELRRRFPDESQRGISLYVVLRSTQFRRFRLPKPQIERGAALANRY